MHTKKNNKNNKTNTKDVAKLVETNQKLINESELVDDLRLQRRLVEKVIYLIIIQPAIS